MEKDTKGYCEAESWNSAESQAVFYVKIEEYLSKERFFLVGSASNPEEERLQIQFAQGIHEPIEDVLIEAAQAMDNASKGEKNYPAKLEALEMVIESAVETFQSSDLLPALKRSLFVMKGDTIKRYAEHITRHDSSELMLIRRRALYEQAISSYIDADTQSIGKITEIGFRVKELFDTIDDSNNALRLATVLTLGEQLPVDPLYENQSAMME